MQTPSREDGTALLRIIERIGQALSTAHSHGIVHGALVPGNLLFDNPSHCWIADFGLARLHPPQSPYLAPELAFTADIRRRAERFTAYWTGVTPLSDQYMFAVLCWTMFTQVLQPQSYQSGISILQRATAHYPEQRFPSIEAFVKTLIDSILARQRFSSYQRASTPQSLPSPDPNRGRPISGGGRQPALPPPSSNPSSQPGNIPLNRAKELERLAGKLFTQHQYPAAIQTYQEALTLDPNNATLWMALGDTFLASELYPEALNAYEKSIALNPNDPEAWANCGTVFEALGRRREAQACYDRETQIREEGG